MVTSLTPHAFLISVFEIFISNISRINCNCKPTLFHTVCIKEWGINYKPECPLCRKNIEKKNIKF